MDEERRKACEALAEEIWSVSEKMFGRDAKIQMAADKIYKFVDETLAAADVKPRPLFLLGKPRIV